MSHDLDRPVWNALLTGWSALAQGDSRARRLDPGVGPFAAAADESQQSRAALAALLPSGGELWLVEPDPPTPLDGVANRSGELVQMVAERITSGPAACPPIAPLGPADAAEMHALATLTRPGPFEARTHEFGGFLGIRSQGRLVAMAGQRMKLPGFTEVSGVCTHPDHRGRGHAAALMRAVAGAILARGETPFLHAYASNAGAIALYESLGFTLRRPMAMLVLGR